MCKARGFGRAVNGRLRRLLRLLRLKRRRSRRLRRLRRLRRRARVNVRHGGHCLPQRRPLQQRLGRGSLRRRHTQQLVDDRAQLLGVVRGRDGRVAASHDLHREAVHVLGVEGVLERGQLVHDAAERPQVRLVGVALPPHELGAHVVGRAHARARQVGRRLEHTAHAKVACGVREGQVR